MLPQDRQSEIMKQLHEFKTVKISELSKELNVTRETIRKDLYEMEEKGLVRKVHGGAILNKANLETSYINRKNTNENEKRSIVKRASEFVENGDTLYIDYGTTALLFTREILSKKDLTIITNSLPIANEVIDYSDFEVIIIGGNVRKNEKSLFGPIAYRVIEKLYVDKGFFGIGGVDIKAGFTNVHMGESEVSRLMLEHCQKNIVMADYSKFNTVSMNQVAPIEEVDVLITDDKADSNLLEQLNEKNVKVITVIPEDEINE
ncbi:DeoR/GlpR family DNA-binding transcription regulator [Niallia sp. NCCP-28]|uniref:DeoR/GlpR family DNA-binding transcription regulator n=1 Tax=Niallia sp. NCCP-28 TaxID=2934712 RepID=UPI002086CEC4|nr:DeoR/GlpR family DNA-binding transcription regulator [Niallia sp. NCCP-28]GKU85145.1 DeoR family transcriptional regulator [Niallia sp. NCCP-28]